MTPVTDDGGDSGVGGGTTPIADTIKSPAVPCLGRQGVRIWGRKTAGAGVINSADYETSYDHGVHWLGGGDDATFLIVGDPQLMIEPGGHAVLIMPAPIGGAFPPGMKCTDIRLVVGTTDAMTAEFRTSTF